MRSTVTPSWVPRYWRAVLTSLKSLHSERRCLGAYCKSTTPVIGFFSPSSVYLSPVVHESPRSYTELGGDLLVVPPIQGEFARYFHVDWCHASLQSLAFLSCVWLCCCWNVCLASVRVLTSSFFDRSTRLIFPVGRLYHWICRCSGVR